LNNLARPSSATHTPIAGSLARSPIDDTAVVEVEEAQEQPDRREMDRVSSKEMEKRPSAESAKVRQRRSRRDYEPQLKTAGLSRFDSFFFSGTLICLILSTSVSILQKALPQGYFRQGLSVEISLGGP
uniref:HCO3_cotransp domain-containing protein n=1 Tax=Haemonchus placei TaxID=6290 RepID=A0A0N4WXB7_HAEPC